MNACFSFPKDAVTVSTSNDKRDFFNSTDDENGIFLQIYVFQGERSVKECFLNVSAKEGTGWMKTEIQLCPALRWCNKKSLWY